MLTKNFYNAVMAYATDKPVTNGLQAYDGSYGELYPQSNGYKFMSSFKYTADTNGKSGVHFGTGTTPSSLDDYKMENWINTTTQITVTNQSDFSFSIEDGALIASASFGVTNKTSEAIPVSEVGYVALLYNGSSFSSSELALLDRTVLEEPIIINPGEAKQLTYTIRMNYPTA